MQQNPIITPNIPWNHIDKTEEVHPSMVAEYVQRGWIILMTYNARDDLTESSWARGYQENTIRSEYRPVVLMGQTTLDALTTEVMTLREEIVRFKKIEMEHTALKKEHETVKTNVADFSRRLRESDDRWNAEFKSRTELETRMRKLEADLGKVRSAIGDIRMKEIVEGTAKP